jgi:nicotinate-nucleotide adenylyltransferase
MAAEFMAQHLGLGRVIFIPAGRPPHKDESRIVPARHRVEMVRLAIGGNPKFELSTLESDLPELSYTYRTFERLAALCGPEAELYYIIGSDVLESIAMFKNFGELCKRCTFAALMRPGARELDIRALAGKLELRHGAKIVFAPFFEVGISSTLIRDIIARGGSARYLLPDSVIAYIYENGLFGAGSAMGHTRA